jgi:hypothetical protein
VDGSGRKAQRQYVTSHKTWLNASARAQRDNGEKDVQPSPQDVAATGDRRTKHPSYMERGFKRMPKAGLCAEDLLAGGLRRYGTADDITAKMIFLRDALSRLLKAA